MNSIGLAGVRSVERTFGVMEIIADSNGEASLSEIASRMGLPMSTIHRILHTCAVHGYVRQLPSRRYVLGGCLVPLGEAAGRQRPWSSNPRSTRRRANCEKPRILPFCTATR